MPTVKQRKVAKLLIENESLDKPLNGGQMLAKVGYSRSMQTAKVNDVLESEGVLEALNDYGFNVENAKKVVGAILETGENDNVKLKAADMIMKVHGAYAPEKVVNMNYNTDTNSPALLAAEQAYLSNLNDTPGPTEG